VAKDFDSPAMPSIKPIAEPPDPRVIPLDRQESLTHNQVEQIRFGLGDTGPLAQAVMNSNISSLQKQLATGAISCLSTRRPADPVQGQMIFETDTKLSYFWDGTAWVTGTGSGAVLTPVGTIVPYAGTDLSTPAGWLFCAGQAVSQTTYAALFAVISTTYNTGGEGAGEFRIPDLRGRVAAGKDNMLGTAASRLTAGVSGITGTTLGAAGGSQALAAHTHTGTTGTESTTHTHGVNQTSLGETSGMYHRTGNFTFGSGDTGGAGGAGSNLKTVQSNGQSVTHTHSFTSNTHNLSAGNSGNTQPTLVTNYIIKATADTVTGYAGTTLTGAAGGDLTGSYPNPALTTISNVPVHNSNSTLSFRTSNVERMGIDAVGRMTRPFQPICQLYNQTLRSPGAPIPWTGTYVNQGSMWNGVTRVTVPVSGVYLLTWEGMSEFTAAAMYVDLFKNSLQLGTRRQYSVVSGVAAHKQIAMHVYENCAAGDYFEWVNQGAAAYSDVSGYMHASCALIA